MTRNWKPGSQRVLLSIYLSIYLSTYLPTYLFMVFSRQDFPGCPGTHSVVDQAGLKLTEIRLPLLPQVLGIKGKACATAAHSLKDFLQDSL